MPIFEAQTPEAILARVLGRMDTVLDTREGSYAYEQAAPLAVELSGVYMAMDELLSAFYIDENSGKYLDEHARIFDMTRRAGSAATAPVTFTGSTGASIPAGAAFFTAAGLEFALAEDVTLEDGAGAGTLEAVEPGAKYNVAAGDISQMLRSVAGVTAFSAGAAAGGTDPESDEALFARIDDRRRHPPASGNPAYYRSLALECDGAGAAKVQRLWQGPGTVRVLVAGYDRGPVDDTVTEAVAGHIDDNRVVGAEVTVASVSGTAVSVTAQVTLAGTATLEAVRTAFAARLRAYLQGLALEQYTVYVNRIAALLMEVDGVVDYASLQVNGGTANITLDDDAVPVAGEVSLT